MKINLALGCTRLILDVCRSQEVLRNQAAYILATALWETNRTMQPVIEAYWLSEAWRAKNLRYYPWHGRGFVQLTWQRNYLRAGKALDVDLIGNPDGALNPDIAARILVTGCVEGWFTGKKLSDYITVLRSDFTGARRIVNGTDKAAEIAAIARDYDMALKAAGYGVTAPPADYATPVTSPPSQGIWAALVAMFWKR